MSPGDRPVWAALYAAAWFQSTSGPSGMVSDEVRATWAADQADRGLAALRTVARSVPGGNAADLLNWS